jgi:hypothetical protein
VLEGRVGRLAGDLQREPALGDLARHLLPLLASLVGELERDDRRARAARALVGVLLGVLDLGAVERRVVVEDEVGVGCALGRLVGLLGLDDDRARVDLDDLGVRRLALARKLGDEVGLGVLRPGDEPVRRGRAEEVVLVVGRVVVVVDRRALGGALDRVVEREAGHLPGLRAAGDVGVARIGLEVGPEDVLLPVVEEELGHLADLLLRPLRVLDVGQADRDLVAARALDLRLGDAELVDALAHDVDGAVDRVLRDLGLGGGRLGLVDELDAPLEVESQPRLLRRDDDGRGGDQARDEEQDQPVAAAIGHSGQRLAPEG